MITSVPEIASRNLPERFELKQNYPNPFNPSTKIRYSIPNVMDANLRPLQTTLKVFDILGREVETLVNETKTAGNYEVNFNAGNYEKSSFYHTCLLSEKL